MRSELPLSMSVLKKKKLKSFIASALVEKIDCCFRSGSASSAGGLASMRSELPLSTLGAPQVSEDDQDSQVGTHNVHSPS